MSARIYLQSRGRSIRGRTRSIWIRFNRRTYRSRGMLPYATGRYDAAITMPTDR